MLTDKLRQHKGAVSILLLIILLPSLTMAGVFMDVARVSLAGEVVTSSADLALNTVMTDYDKTLKDYYGLIASAQDSSEIIEVSKQYFIDSMKSQGVPTSEATEYVETVLDAFFGDEDISDMLRITPTSEIKIERTKNGAMDNTALLKEGINEFMKYRSPVNGAAKIFEKLAGSDVAEKMEDVSDEAKMIDAREKFYTAEKNLIKQAEVAYKAIKAYEDTTSVHTKEPVNSQSVASEKYLNAFSGFLMDPIKNSISMSKTTKNGLANTVADDFREICRDAHYKMVKDMYNTRSTESRLPFILMSTKSIGEQPENTAYSIDVPASAAKIETKLKDLSSALNTYKSRKSALDAAWGNTRAKASGDYPLQYWVKVHNNCSTAYSNYVAAAQNLQAAANALDNAVTYAAEEAMSKKIALISNSHATMPATDKEGKVTISAMYNALWNAYSSVASEAIDGCSSYWNVTNAINGVSSSKSLSDPAKLNHIYNLAVDIKGFKMDADNAAKRLKTAKTETEKLKKLVEEYAKTFEAWKTAANKSTLDDNELAKQDRELIQKKETASEDQGGMVKITKESADQLANRLGNIQTLYSTLDEDLGAITYMGKSVTTLNEFKNFRNACKLSGNIPVNETELNDYAENQFKFFIPPRLTDIRIKSGTSTNLIADTGYVITDSFHPDLSKTELGLYNWMKQKFAGGGVKQPVTKEQTGFDVKDEKTAESADGKINDKGSDKAGDAKKAIEKDDGKGKNFKDWKGATLPSKSEFAPPKESFTEKIAEAATFASNIFTNFGPTFMASLENIRDDLFTLDYIFSMFTYDTFEKEGYYDNVPKENQNKITLSNTSQYYTDEVKQKWKDSYDYKTLTLNERDTAHNWCYRAEVEYILYGNGSNAINKVAAYGEIFLLRYALDLAPVFQFYWNDKALVAVAAAIEAFFYIPAGLTKTLACLAITLGEAGADIALMKEGIPVLLYKSQEQDLICNYNSIFMDEAEKPGRRDGITLSYSDYLKIFLYIKLVDDENQIYLRTGDVIQANMSLVHDKKDKFALSNSQVYFTMSGTTTIEPMWSRLLAIDNLGDMVTATGWRSMEFSMTRGY